MTNPDPPDIQPAARELLALAEQMRPRWDIPALQGALAAARNAGWTWTRTFACVAALLTDPEASPRDVLAACQNPVHRQTGQPPNEEFITALRETFPQARPAEAAQ